MSRYRLRPTPAQEAVLRGHCAHARYVWNLAVEQHAHWRPGRAGAPGYLKQCRQLTEARAEHPWLAAGSQTVQRGGCQSAYASWWMASPGMPSDRAVSTTLVTKVSGPHTYRSRSLRSGTMRRSEYWSTDALIRSPVSSCN